MTTNVTNGTINKEYQEFDVEEVLASMALSEKIALLAGKVRQA